MNLLPLHIQLLMHYYWQIARHDPKCPPNRSQQGASAHPRCHGMAVPAAPAKRTNHIFDLLHSFNYKSILLEFVGYQSMSSNFFCLREPVALFFLPRNVGIQTAAITISLAVVRGCTLIVGCTTTTAFCNKV